MISRHSLSLLNVWRPDERPARRNLGRRLSANHTPGIGEQAKDAGVDVIAIQRVSGAQKHRLDRLDVRAEPLHEGPDRRHHHRGRGLAALT